MLGVARDGGLLGKNLFDFLPPERRAPCASCLSDVFDKATTAVRLETALVRANGKRFPVELNIGQFVWDGQTTAQVIVRDITEHKRAELLLEAERRRVAYDLHDGLAQVAASAHQHL